MYYGKPFFFGWIGPCFDSKYRSLGRVTTTPCLKTPKEACCIERSLNRVYFSPCAERAVGYGKICKDTKMCIVQKPHAEKCVQLVSDALFKASFLAMSKSISRYKLVPNRNVFVSSLQSHLSMNADKESSVSLTTSVITSSSNKPCLFMGKILCLFHSQQQQPLGK